MTIDEFKNIDLRVGRIVSAERVQNSEKLVKLEVDIGDPSSDSGLGKRQIIAGIGKEYSPENLPGKEIVVVANLEPRKFTIRSDSGQVVLESQGMLLAAHGENGSPVILAPEKEVPPGSKIT